MSRNAMSAKMNSIMSMFAAIILFIAIIPSPILGLWDLFRFYNSILYLGLVFAFGVDIAYGFFKEKRLFALHCFFLFLFGISAIYSKDSIVLIIAPLYVAGILSLFIIRQIKIRGYIIISFIFCLDIILNFLTFLSGGFYQYDSQNKMYFLGIRVNVDDIMIFSLGLCGVLIYSNRRIFKLLALLTFLSAVVFIIFEKVSTGIMGVTLFCILFIIFISRRNFDRAKLLFSLISVIVLLSSIILTINNDYSHFSWLIEDILGESITLDGRTDIWASCLSQIHGVNWIWGYGINHGIKFYIGNSFVSHPHNVMLDVLVKSGLIGLCLFGLMLYQEMKSIHNCKNKILFSIMSAAFVGSLVVGFAHNYFTKPFWIIWYVCCTQLNYLEEEK